jgi:hypothetical protein
MGLSPLTWLSLGAIVTWLPLSLLSGQQSENFDSKRSVISIPYLQNSVWTTGCKIERCGLPHHMLARHVLQFDRDMLRAHPYKYINFMGAFAQGFTPIHQRHCLANRCLYAAGRWLFAFSGSRSEAAMSFVKAR